MSKLNSIEIASEVHRAYQKEKKPQPSVSQKKSSLLYVKEKLIERASIVKLHG